MCGIAGMAGFADEALLKEMLALTRHRGPDDTGTYMTAGEHGPRVALGNNRLSIIDCSPAGHQPMSNEDGSVWVAYNGEIFNFLELRAELEADGHYFRSRSDTEVLVHAYEKYGAAMVERLNGMFGFAIWDERLQTLLLARDRMGVKPLYYAVRGGRLFFASEVKALLLVPEIQPEMDREVLAEYLSLLYVPSSRTMFKGIRKLPPGHLLTWRHGEINVRRYWRLRYDEPHFSAGEDELARQLHETLVAATRRQLISDVPVGFFLSGGIDSSTLVACAAEAGVKDLHCYSIAFRDQDGQTEQSSDDPRFARQVAGHFGAQFHEIVAEPDVCSLLPKAVWHLDEPVADHAAIATYLICEAARGRSTVLLSGQGGDEIMAGYRVHVMPRLAARVRWLPRWAQQSILRLIRPLHGRGGRGVPGVSPGLIMAGARFTERLFRLAQMPPRDQYFAARSYVTSEELQQLLLPEVAAATTNPGSAFQRFFDEVKDEDLLNQLLYVDSNTFLPDFNLTYSDKLSMASSVEVRVPFLDNAVVEFMQRVPPGLKIRGFDQKFLLKKAMRGKLPEGVLRRRKAGFGLPVRSWLKNEMRPMVRELLSPQAVNRRGLLSPALVERWVRENEEGTRDRTQQIWTLLTLELWCRTFTDAGLRQALRDEAVTAHS